MRAGPGNKIGQSYKQFCHDYGLPDHLNFGGSISKVGNNTLFMKTINKYGTRYHVSIPRRLNKNPTKDAIREIKKMVQDYAKEQGTKNTMGLRINLDL